jgi:DnaD/phage-associated family protein
MDDTEVADGVRYATVRTEIWRNPDFRGLPKDLKMLFLYLLTSEHSNMIGYYYLPIAYIHHDTQFPYEQVPSLLRDLCDREKIHYDFEREVVLIEKYIDQNPLRGDNHRRGAELACATVPKGPLLERFVECACLYAPEFTDTWLGLSKGLGRGFEGVRKGGSSSEKSAKVTPPNTGTGTGTDTGADAGAETTTATAEVDRLYAWFKSTGAEKLASPQLRAKWGRYLHEGLPREVIQLAVEEAAGAGIDRPNYITAILDRWKREGVTSIETAREAIVKGKGERGKPTSGRSQFAGYDPDAILKG